MSGTTNTVIRKTVDLTKPIKKTYLDTLFTTQDKNAHQIDVRLLRDGVPVQLHDGVAVFGYFIRYGDNVTIPIEGSASGDTASITLSGSCYNKTGQFAVIVKVSCDECDNTVFYGEGSMCACATDTVVQEEFIPSLPELLAQIDAMEDATADSRAQQEAVHAAEAAREDAEAERVAAEKKREGHESTRQKSESNRATFENARISSETTRRNAETARTEAETARSDAETARAAAEEQRAANEAARDAAEKERESAEEARDAAEQARAAAEQEREETFAGYEERLVAATPDDTTVNGRAWSSKKTVDSLCLPFEASGNPVQVYPVEGYPLGVRVGWEPVQAGSGDPSPDNIRPITGRDALSLTRCGKNLVRHKYAPGYTETRKGLTYVVNDDYSVTVTGTCTNETYYNFYEIKKLQLFPYTIDAMGRTVTDNGFTIRDVVAQPHAVDGTRLYLVFLAGKTVDKTYYPMLTYGEETDYEPYTGSTTDIALPETVYGGTLDVETGVLTVDRAVIKPDGDSLKFTPNASGDFWNLPQYSAHGVLGTSAYTGLIVSSHFNKKFSSNETREFIYTSATSMSGLYDTVDDFNTYIAAQYAAGTPVQIVYPLKEPRTIQLDKHQIAALSGVNTLYTDSGTLTVTGREDPRHTIVTLTDRIAALESAAAGV